MSICHTASLAPDEASFRVEGAAGSVLQALQANRASNWRPRRWLGMRPAKSALLALALAACQQPTDTNIVIDNQVNAAEAANAEIETLPPSEESGAPAPTGNAAAPPLNETEDDSENSPSTAVIPAQYRGRWGMNANDCDPRRSDNKGLMTVRANSIRFYESTATLQEQRPAIATSFSGTYIFTGEGQTWERVVTLTRTGNTLKRADNEGSFIYTRCS